MEGSALHAGTQAPGSKLQTPSWQELADEKKPVPEIPTSTITVIPEAGGARNAWVRLPHLGPVGLCVFRLLGPRIPKVPRRMLLPVIAPCCLAHDEVLSTREYRSLGAKIPKTLEGLPDDQPESINCFFAGLGYDARMLQAGLSLLGIRRSHQ